MILNHLRWAIFEDTSEIPPLPTSEYGELVGMQQNQASWVQLKSVIASIS